MCNCQLANCQVLCSCKSCLKYVLLPSAIQILKRSINQSIKSLFIDYTFDKNAEVFTRARILKINNGYRDNTKIVPRLLFFQPQGSTRRGHRALMMEGIVLTMGGIERYKESLTQKFLLSLRGSKLLRDTIREKSRTIHTYRSLNLHQALQEKFKCLHHALSICILHKSSSRSD